MHDLPSVICDLRVESNNENHRTNELSKQSRLFLRRGQEFTITLRFQNPPRIKHEQLENITLTAKTGPNPSKKNGTKNKFRITSLGDRKTWSARVIDAQQGLWTISVTTPSSAIIGKYTLLLKASKPKSFSQDIGVFVILFNPWCKEDPVFLENEGWREEYVLNEDGIIYLGTESCILQHPWHFGQFESEIADISIKFLDMNPYYRKAPKKEYLKRNDPIYVTRVLGDVISRKDEEDRVAFMVKNGRPSYSWISSVPVLHKWFQTECQTLYGHHWVFAAVLCTVLRCLGIPTRLVTNYNSAYDTGCKLQQDIYYNRKGARIHRARSDSICNFHVWNECWMERKDLPPEYSGWQAVDATAQMRHNDSLSVSGPAPVRAIKQRHLGVNYDVGHMFSKLVTDTVVWVQNADGHFKKVHSWSRPVGDSITTKSVGSDMQKDIVHNYKYPKGSEEEKEVLKRDREKMLEDHHHNETRDILLSPASVFISSKSFQIYANDIHFKVTVANVSGEQKDFQLVVGAQPVHDSGFTQAQFWKEEFSFHLKPNEESSVSIQLCHSLYEASLLDNNLLRITALVKDPTYGNVALAEEDIAICNPCLSLQIPNITVQYQPTMAMVHISNPLEETLNDCVVTASGKGLFHNKRKYRCGDMAPGGTLAYPITFTPTQVGARRLYVQLENRKFRSINIFNHLEVLPADVHKWSNHQLKEFQKHTETFHTTSYSEPSVSVYIQSDDIVFYGQNIAIKTVVSNQSWTDKELDILLCAQYMNENGSLCPDFWKAECNVSLQAHSEKSVGTRISHVEYANFMWESSLIRLMCLVKDMTSTASTSRIVTLYKPILSIQMQREALQYQYITAIISITNPIRETLQDCVLTVSGQSLIYRERQYSCGNIDPESTEAYKIRFTPTQIGIHEFHVRFDCNYFRDVRNSKNIEVLPCQNPNVSG